MKTKIIVASIIIILIGSIFYRQAKFFFDQGKINCESKVQLIENKIQDNVIETKTIQQKISAKISTNSDYASRVKWLQLLKKEREDSNSR